jgi:hypothetical protein
MQAWAANDQQSTSSLVSIHSQNNDQRANAYREETSRLQREHPVLRAFSRIDKCRFFRVG